ncbi:MAG TPA: LysR family transcriptional regulator [Gemmatimonadaceae bacterium]|nr:LysR family transcriptional regulator [Gemmatimonadaceae bacterium]
MRMTLDVEAVRAFVLVADLKSFTRAAEVLGSTQGAVSVKLKRLEDRLGARLIERTPRQVRLSSHGTAFLEAARAFVAAHERAVQGVSGTSRRFALGVAAHVAGPELPAMLARVHAYDPMLVIDVQIATSRRLLDALDQGMLDAAIIWREDDRRRGEVLAKDTFGWFAAPSFSYRRGEPLRLASLAADCGVRDLAIRALDAAGIPWTEAFHGRTAAAVRAGVEAGLAVAALSHRVAPAGTVDVGTRFHLPRLRPMDIVLHAGLTDIRSRDIVRTLAAAFRETTVNVGQDAPMVTCRATRV